MNALGPQWKMKPLDLGEAQQRVARERRHRIWREMYERDRLGSRIFQVAVWIVWAVVIGGCVWLISK